MDTDIARRQMIGQQLRAWDVLDDRVLDVIEAVPRELFVPTEWRGLAYADTEIPLGRGRQLAPPAIQGRMLQALLPRADERALELGSGTGYLTACLAGLCAQVTSVEPDAELAATARANLASLGVRNVRLLQGDGLAMDFPEQFDVICVNGSLPERRPALERLLAPGGRLFVVTGKAPAMEAARVTRTGAAEWVTERIFETSLQPLDNARETAEFVF
jgi:protein-L-isoaspartate(D-aspartate) O-methyltransferase